MKSIALSLVAGFVFHGLVWAASPPKIVNVPLGVSVPTVLLTPKAYVAGIPAAEVDAVTGAGEVNMHDRFSGKLLRTLRPQSAVMNANFGTALAQAGGELLVGTPGQNRVDLFSLTTGKFLASLVPTNPVGDGAFGSALAVEGRWLCVGANNDNLGRGAVYVFDLKTRQQVRKLTASDAAAGDGFGFSVGMSGGLVVVGCPGDDHGVEFDGGSGYLFDVVMGTQISKFIASDMAANRLYGYNTKLRGERAFVSALRGNGGRGAVSYVDAAGSLEILQVNNPESKVSEGSFGYFMAVEGALLAVSHLKTEPNRPGYVRFFDAATGGELGDFTPSGAAYVVQSPAAISLQGGTLATAPSPFSLGNFHGSIVPGLAGPPGTVVLAGQGDATSATGIYQGKTLTAALASNGNHTIISGATGPLTTGGKNKILSRTGLVTFLKGSSFGGMLLKDFRRTWMNESDDLMLEFDAQVESLGSATRRALRRIGLGSVNIHTGATIGANPSGEVAKFHIVRQSSDTVNRHWGMVYGLRIGAGFALPSQDSGIRVAGPTNTDLFHVGEGDSAPVNGGDPAAPLFGEFAKRMSLNQDAVFSTALTNAPTGTTQGVFRRTLAGPVMAIARQGNTAEGTSSAIFSAFLSEAGSTSGLTVFRASLKGGDATAAMNEGLWRKVGASARELIARKGGPVAGLTGVVWKKFLRYWVIGNQVLVLGQIGGTNVNSSNDSLLMLLQENDVWLQVLREGDLAPGCLDAQVGVFQRIELDPSSGRYGILVSLAGASSASNQALLTGGTLVGSPINQSGRRIPHLLMRKGAAHQVGFASLGTVRGMSILSSPAEPAGASGIGEGRCVNASGEIMLEIFYGGTTRQTVKASLP